MSKGNSGLVLCTSPSSVAPHRESSAAVLPLGKEVFLPFLLPTGWPQSCAGIQMPLWAGQLRGYRRGARLGSHRAAAASPTENSCGSPARRGTAGIFKPIPHASMYPSNPLRGYGCDASPTCCTASLRQVTHRFLPGSSRESATCHEQPVGVTHRHLWTPGTRHCSCVCSKERSRWHRLCDPGRKNGVALIPAAKMPDVPPLGSCADIQARFPKEFYIQKMHSEQNLTPPVPFPPT